MIKNSSVIVNVLETLYPVRKLTSIKAPLIWAERHLFTVTSGFSRWCFLPPKEKAEQVQMCLYCLTTGWELCNSASSVGNILLLEPACSGREQWSMAPPAVYYVFILYLRCCTQYKSKNLFKRCVLDFELIYKKLALMGEKRNHSL